MKLIYEGVDITKGVDIMHAVICDNAGGKSDDLEIIFSDRERNWSRWNPKKGDKIILSKDAFSSGNMYVDDFSLYNGKFKMKAKSLPLHAKTPKVNMWEEIRFIKLAEDMAKEVGLKLETYDIKDYLYKRIDQVDINNIEFLNQRCILEGYGLKVTDDKAIIYDERVFERYKPVIDIYEDMLYSNYEFKSSSFGLYSSCSLSYLTSDNKLINYVYSPNNAPNGTVMKTNIRATNLAEAERYTKNLLRSTNKFEYTGNFSIDLNTSLAATNIVDVKDLGSFSGRYFIESIRHNLINNISSVSSRKIMEELL
ncbi:phage late control D family protein [Clostridium cylindrosporum]|uniref:Uncharacterized protein n=1 Tax=Clostridium cylindrosporum DSM 605 TaxID=1121307 RepID=A0A0J8DB12_CLOCY|nr:hypothetical protein [Clostridium cylindrosporum]KMT23012.1 hypothetical protein CLCY_7c00590 [Clostridium cylindrosporum DSM 605]